MGCKSDDFPAESGILSGKMSFDEQFMSQYVDKLAQNVVKYLDEAGLTIALAESCTGGLLAQSITGVSGASKVFECGVVSYSERIKSKLLGVDPTVIETKGVVSAEVASLMAKGAAALAGADIGVGITGIAGPSGGTKSQPVGTIYVCVCFKGQEQIKNLKLYEINKLSDTGSDSRAGALTRRQNRLAAAAYALETVIKAVAQDNG